MRLPNTSLFCIAIVIGALLALPFEKAAAAPSSGSNQTGDSSWPREKFSNRTRLIIYQPQVARSGETLQWAKLPAAICMPDTMATFTTTQVTAGRSTIMGAGTL
jgi:hypothetical protein